MNKLRKIFILSLCIFSPFLNANNSVASEASHVIGGFAIGSIATGLTDYYFPEYRSERGWIGFWTNTAIAAIMFGIEMAQDSSDTSGELMDFGFSVLGGAFGAYTTDHFILTPVTTEAPDGSPRYGVQVTHKF
ncbi:hypothetical protein [Nitratifractor sp.]|uniref:hypothetical protein n=1 Tax=Nitratifractor sp. TaxID=2268144 RepID=UPI0025DE369A|nr:hypothetical protein [Nitratifractor sp.]